MFFYGYENCNIKVDDGVKKYCLYERVDERYIRTLIKKSGLTVIHEIVLGMLWGVVKV
jgi:hypothetical protein